MNILTIPLLEGEDLILKIPASLNEISFGQLIELQKFELTNFEALSVLGGVPVDDLYNANSYQNVTKMAKLYIDLFNHSLQAGQLNKLPRKIKLNVDGKRKTIKLERRLSMNPTGAYLIANKIISGEIYGYIDLYGEENWQSNFNPTLEGCAGVVNAFLYCKVTRKGWSDNNQTDFASHMNAADVLTIAKYFYNNFPELTAPKPSYKSTVIAKSVALLIKLMFRKNVPAQYSMRNKIVFERRYTTYQRILGGPAKQ